jgi:cobalt-zinc-cadmium efflux system membrane fusion protein
MIQRKTLLVFAVLVGAIIAHEGHVALPSRGATVNLEKGTIVLSRESRDALGVETAEISTKPLPDSTSAYVTLVSPWTKHAFASSRLPGRIASLQAAPGKTVRAGQPLAEIESLELETLQEDLLKARTERRLSERLLESLRESGGAVAGQTVLEAETTLEQQKNAEVIGRIKWRSLGLDETALDAFLADPTKRVKRLVITAPLDGTVIHADVAMGRVVEPGEHLFEIVDLSTVWAKIGVLERDVDRALIGGKVEIRLTARPNEKLEAHIDAVAPSLDGPGRTATAWATIANPSSAEPAWLPGMTGRARLMQSSRGEAKVVPASALVDDGLSQYVLVEEAAAQKQSEYRRKDVVVVRRTANSVEVRATSLYPGDRVVTRGAQQLGGFFVPGVLKLSPEAVATIGLKTAPVERRTVESVFEVDGLVDLPPESKSAASTRLGGNILRLHVDRGQRVKRGDLLAELQSVEFQTLQLDLLREELAVRLADRRLRSLQSLGGAVPQRQVLEIEATVVSARSRRDTLRLRLEALGVAASQIDELLERSLLIDSIPVRAPIDGVVASFDRALGQVVRAEEPLFAVYDLSQSLVKGLVSERDVGRLSLGQPVRVRFSSRPEDWVAGKFVRTSGVFSADHQAMSIWVETDVGARHSLRLGQLARISVASDEPAMAASLVVPPSALIREAARSYVFVRKADGAFERRAVSTGRSNDVHVEVVSGLVDGETVAVRGASGLQTAHASIR